MERCLKPSLEVYRANVKFHSVNLFEIGYLQTLHKIERKSEISFENQPGTESI